ncbi:hypothetical protein Vadar_008225 [Vaccinium darrowii]|nr:hypothetical protein Vadar_008225 [Vaccinium darrowii]
MKAQIESLAKQVKGKAPTTVEELVQNTNSSFTPEVMREPLPLKFKMPHIDTFNGSTDPLDHLETYKNLMMLQAVPDEIMCRAFPVTLNGSARMWFNKLKPQSIGNFKELSKSFVSIAAYIAGLNSGQLLFSLTKDPPVTVAELMMRPQKHMNAEDALSARRYRDDNNDFNPYQTGWSGKPEREQTGSSKDFRTRKPKQRREDP